MRKEGESLVIEPAPTTSLIAVLATLSPIEEEFPSFPDAAPDPVAF